ncbi:hypothetical protein K488DRAFT_90394 [Vararia minispora EC-137]|uniref:Uncharacterized protein n=1 Tax=Vararia minispora EC-137 TaxID=1314806 RepID=A0ACB8Q9E1_9AGAM|nr:hypothetical protein K488DRAFT_90394 [Vararia minispora EC-137]
MCEGPTTASLVQCKLVDSAPHPPAHSQDGISVSTHHPASSGEAPASHVSESPASPLTPPHPSLFLVPPARLGPRRVCPASPDTPNQTSSRGFRRRHRRAWKPARLPFSKLQHLPPPHAPTATTAQLALRVHHLCDYLKDTYLNLGALRDLFRSVNLTALCPYAQIDIHAHILAHKGAPFSACVNTTSLALLPGGVPMRDLAAAVTTGMHGATVLCDPAAIAEAGMLSALAVLPGSEKIMPPAMRGTRTFDVARKTADVLGSTVLMEDEDDTMAVATEE